MSRAYQQTAAEYVADWDAGATCYSVDTSGRGPAFEEPVQVIATEVLRVCTQLTEYDLDAFGQAFELTLRSLQPNLPAPLTGVQQRHARWLALKILELGPAGLIAEVGADHVLPIQPTAKAHTPQKSPIAATVAQVLAGKRVH